MYTPKPLLPLLGRPMVMRIIDSLPEEVDTVVLAVSYMKDRLLEHFRENDCGREVILVNEERPLGTGGAIKNVSRYLDDTFLCFNGDIVSSLDVRDLMSFHRRRKGIGTLSLWRVSDPSAFGVVGMKGDRITDFQEKPAPGTAISDLINAGVYVFEPELLDHIPPGTASLERQVFPRILDKGLHGYRFYGYWVDCGTPQSYLGAQAALLDNGGALMAPSSQEGVSVIGPNHIYQAHLRNCRVGPYVCAMKGSVIMDGATVERSVLMEGARVGRGCKVSDCLIGPGACVEDGESIHDDILVMRRARA